MDCVRVAGCVLSLSTALESGWAELSAWVLVLFFLVDQIQGIEYNNAKLIKPSSYSILLLRGESENRLRGTEKKYYKIA